MSASEIKDIINRVVQRSPAPAELVGQLSSFTYAQLVDYAIAAKAMGF